MCNERRVPGRCSWPDLQVQNWINATRQPSAGPAIPDGPGVTSRTTNDLPVQRRRLLAGAGALLALPPWLAACEPTPADVAKDATEQRLVGTWLREYVQDGTPVRRVLVLGSDGKFQERYRASGSGDADIAQAHAGDWVFDGTNLKRHYTVVDGKPATRANVLFATLEIRFPSKHEFIGVDRVRKREVRYQRVDEGTQP